ncbi:MAG TPA: TonB-dependent receptor, partial [Gemmatimonadales bacterium]|nr:TonB-dependent receptor [Gemmatimonadales bacterium]
QVVPRAGVVYGGPRGFNAKLLYGEAFRSPTPGETEINAPGLITGNPQLDPERIRTGELVLSLRGEREEVALNLFTSQQRNLIAFTPLPSGGLGFQNRDVFDARGAELEAALHPSAAWSLLGSVSFQDNELNDTLSNVGRAPQWMVRVGASWSPRPSLTLSLFDNWLGAAPPITRQYPGVAIVNPPNEAYHLVSARVTVGLGPMLGLPSSTQLSARLGVDNLLDEETWYPDATFGGVNTLPWRPGRVVFAGLTLNWRGK